MVTLTCPHCGGAITVSVGANPAQIPGPNPAQVGANGGANPDIAQMVLGSTKDGRQPYNQGYPASFEEFWKVYPMRKSKRKALIAWRKSIKSIGANPIDAMAQILAGAKRYAEEVAQSDVAVKYAEGWLNDARWEDEPMPIRGAPKTVTEDDYRRITRD